MRLAAYLLRLLFLTCLCAFMLWGAGLAWFIGQIPWQADDTPTHTDAVIALTGGRARLDHALERLSEGKASKLFISGVETNVPLRDLFPENPYRTQLSKLTDNNIEIGYVARDTKGNAHETADWMDMKRYRSLRLVTANYHMPRSVLEFRHAMPDVRIVPDPVFPPPFDSPNWFKSREGVTLVLSEYHKYVASLLHALFL